MGTLEVVYDNALYKSKFTLLQVTFKCKILTFSSFSSFCRHRTETLSSSIWHNPCTIMPKKRSP